MLSEFLRLNRAELIERCQSKAAKRNQAERIFNPDGIPLFISQLVEEFRALEARAAASAQKGRASAKPTLSLVKAEVQATAAKHGVELRRQGLSIDQVVHDYGDLCQALTELAIEQDIAISVDQFHTFNRCLDDAIAEAVTAFTRHPTHPATHWGVMEEKPESVEQQIRNLLKSAVTSFAAIRSGQVALKGVTSSLHERSLVELQELFEVVLSDSEPADSGRDAAP